MPKTLLASTTKPESLAPLLLSWFDDYGRHDLPWQQPRSPYRVWLSEVMLQQTQVATVIPYFERFVERFKNVAELAAADVDEVLQLWAGLGYYARGRNLHRAAQAMVQNHNAEVPAEFEALLALPGIGRSTAAAILAQAYDQRHAILDGNVKRVLSRLAAIDGWPGQSSVAEQLWQLADEITPPNRSADYTQAIMDLGATLCTRSNPDCGRCPWQHACQAHLQNKQAEYPHRKPRKDKRKRFTTMLVIRNSAGEVLLQRRPPSGIWGGLWSLPQAGEHELLAAAPELVAVGQQLEWEGRALRVEAQLRPLAHEFSHYSLAILPLLCSLEAAEHSQVSEPEPLQWCNLMYDSEWPGLPAPVVRILAKVAADGGE